MAVKQTEKQTLSTPPENPHGGDRYRDARYPFDDSEAAFGVPPRHWSQARVSPPPIPDPDPRESAPANRTPRVLRMPPPEPKKPD